MRGALCAAIAAIGTGLSAISAADTLSPMMDPDRDVQCMRDPEGHVWRIQCTEATKVCLYAPDDELDSTGARAKPLELARDCAVAGTFDRAALEARGFTMVQGRPDAPWGWMRDERGRVFQINFDLKKRLYFGVGWTPQKIVDQLDEPLEDKRSSLDFGLFVFEQLSDDRRTRHRIRLMEGEVHVAPFSAELVVAHYDMSHKFLDPLVRITTFVGPPQRHDLHLDLGVWSEAGGLEIHPTPTGHSQLWKHGTGMVTLDLWHSPTMDSYLRVRTGLGVEGQFTDGTGYRSALVAESAIDLDMVLDNAGFHNLRFELAHEMPRYFIPLQNDQKLAQRLRAHLQYEAVILAINDQPLTLKLAAGGEKRDDLLGVPDRWAFIMDAGLRFSLWAPPRLKS